MAPCMRRANVRECTARIRGVAGVETVCVGLFGRQFLDAVAIAVVKGIDRILLIFFSFSVKRFFELSNLVTRKRSKLLSACVFVSVCVVCIPKFLYMSPQTYLYLFASVSLCIRIYILCFILYVFLFYFII